MRLIFPFGAAVHLLLCSMVLLSLLLEQKEKCLPQQLLWQPQLHPKGQILGGCAIWVFIFCSWPSRSCCPVSSLEPAPGAMQCPRFHTAVLPVHPVPGASQTHTPQKGVAPCELLSLLCCMPQPTCLESSQPAFVLADGKSRKALTTG